ncbi:hypothetical protein O3M35_013035 [Rhynocoris fuscipes]|uniref:Uncharacterized protein n=1 Tax=Rhynocoris fuscipes TaxID=488301 RepID=A0AAW1CF33_9HEMI
MKRRPYQKDPKRLSGQSGYYECLNAGTSSMEQETPCEMEEHTREALSQIEEIKKYMIGATEFDVMEKLIDLNAPKYVIEFQMKRIEEEEQGLLNKTKPSPSSFMPPIGEIEDEIADVKCDPEATVGNIPLRRGDTGHKLSPKQSSFKVNVPQPTAYSLRGYTSETCPTEKEIYEDPCEYLGDPCSENDLNETKIIQDLKVLLDAEYADAKCVSSYLPGKILTDTKTCEGLSFKETVERGLEAAKGKLTEKEDTVHPEVAAAMLHSEEKGVGLSNTPREIFDTLFPTAKDKIMIEVTSASSAKPRDVLPLPTSMKTKEILQKEDAALLDFSRENKFCLPVPHLQEDSCENEDDVLGVVDSQLLSDEAATFKVMISSDGRKTYSNIQMRGTQPPSWFPGYLFVTPDNCEVLCVEKPWTVLEKAWYYFRPSNVKPKKGPITVGL